MNVITVVGRNVKDVEVLKGKNGKGYVKGSIAIDNPFKEAGVDFINYIAFGKTAEIIYKYTGKKGEQLALSGRLEIDNYKDKNGNSKQWVQISVNNVTLLNNKEVKDDEPVLNITADDLPF